MQTKHARLLFVLSIFLLSLVVIDFVRLGEKSKQSHSSSAKVDLADKVGQIGRVLAGCSPCFEFFLKDSSNSLYIPDAKVTLLTQEPFNFSSFDFGSHGTSTYAIYLTVTDGSLKPGYTMPATVQISISRNGYISKTTSINSDISNLSTVYLTKVSQSQSTQGKSLEFKTETIKTVSLPAEFNSKGTETTDLSKISDVSKVENFTLDSGKNTIKFASAVDLSATDTKDKFKTLDTYVKVDKVGLISIDSQSLPTLNKPATLIMRGLTFVKTPRILVNGVEDPSVTKLISYNDGVLTFSVTHFSTFTVAPTVGINEPANNFETKNSTVTLKGTVSDPTASVSAKLNNKNLGKLKVATDGAFEKQVDLEDGLNKIVVSALGINLATASASVSGTLLKNVNSLTTPLSILLTISGILAIGVIVWTFKHLKRNMDIKVKETKKEEKLPDPMSTPPTI